MQQTSYTHPFYKPPVVSIITVWHKGSLASSWSRQQWRPLPTPLLTFTRLSGLLLVPQPSWHCYSDSNGTAAKSRSQHNPQTCCIRVAYSNIPTH